MTTTLPLLSSLPAAFPTLVLLVKATCLLLAALAAAVLLRRASAGSRHLVWLVALIGLLALPAVAGLAWLRPSYARAARRLRASERLTAVPGIPVLTAVMDVAKMAGWLAGRRHRSPR
jgi:hypothetical protein